MSGPLSATGTTADGVTRPPGPGSVVRADVIKLPEAAHRLCQELAEATWHAGYDCALRDIAAGAAELDDAWRPAGRDLHEQRVGERVALFESHAIGYWPGLDNGGVPPSADWVPDTSALTTKAKRGLSTAAQYDAELCRMCRPPAGILCRCAGVTTYRRVPKGQAAA